MNDTTTKEFILRIFEEKDKYIDSRLKNIDRAVELAASHLETRLHNLNEWKAQTMGERRHFVSCEVFERTIDNLKEKTEDLEKANASQAGMLKILVPISAVIGGLLGAAISALLT